MATDEDLWIDTWSIIALYGAREPHDYLPKLREVVERLSVSHEWQRWWKDASNFSRLDFDMVLGTDEDYACGDVKFRRKGDGLRAEMCSLASQADFYAIDTDVLVTRDLVYLFEAYQARYKIELPRPPSILPSAQTTENVLPPAAAKQIFEDTSSLTPFLELHIPLIAGTDVDADAYQYPWILDVEAYLEDLETAGRLQVIDDGDEVDDEYLFFITGRADNDLIEIAADIATRPGVPRGVYAVLKDGEDNSYGVGTRVELGGQP